MSSNTVQIGLSHTHPGSSTILKNVFDLFSMVAEMGHSKLEFFSKFPISKLEISKLTFPNCHFLMARAIDTKRQ